MRATTVSDLGAHVRSARRARGMTQADLAELIGVGRDWVVRLEQGRPRLEAQKVLDALVVLGVLLDVRQPDTQQATAPTDAECATDASTRSVEDGADPFEALFATKNRRR